MKYNIFHTERTGAAGLPYGPALATNTRREGGAEAYDTREEAEAVMREMQSAARAHGQSEYADALHVERDTSWEAA